MLHHQLRESALLFLARLITRRTRLVVAACIALAVLSVLYAFTSLEFLTDRNQLVSDTAEYNKLFLALREEFGKQEDIVVVFKGNDPEELKAFAEELDLRFQKHPDLIQHVFYRTDMSVLKTKGLYYLPEESLGKLHQQLIAMTPFVTRFGARPGYGEAVKIACDEMETALKTGRPGNLDASFDPGFVTFLFDQAYRALKQEPLEAFDLESLFAGDLKGEFRIYNFSGDQKFLFMTVMPIEKANAFHPMLPCVNVIREELADLAPQFPTASAGVTGSPVLAADEMVDSTMDSIRSAILSVICVTILFITFFRRIVEPVISVFTLLIGICWSIGFTTLTIGHLNLLSVAFCTILIGLGIDFGVHVLYRMQEETRAGRSLDEVIQAMLMGAGPGLITSAVTTSVAFGMAWFTKFRGIAELGFVAGSGILFCLLAALILLPALLKLRGIAIPKAREVPADPTHHAVVDQPAFHPWLILFCGLAVTGVGLYGIQFVPPFDDNLLRLQAEGLSSVEWEHTILKEAGQSTWYGALMVDNLDEVREKRVVFENLREVHHVDDVTRMLPENQEARRPLLRPLAEAVAGWPGNMPAETPVDVPALVRDARKLNFLLGVIHSLVSGQAAGLVPVEKLNALHKSLNRFLAEMETASSEAAASAIASCQKPFIESFNQSLAQLQATVKAAPVTPSDIPEALRSRFVGVTGKYYMRIYPSDDIWESRERKVFVDALRGVDARVTGAPIQVHESSILMLKGYEHAGLYAFAVIVILIYLDFRKVKAMLMAMLPLFVGVSWTLGIMAWSQTSFNLANLLALPLIIGIGVANGIHLVHRFREDGESASLASSTTGRAVILCSLTSMIGFGTMVFATHRGISSLGFVLLAGLGSCLIASVTILPAVMHVVAQNKWKV